MAEAPIRKADFQIFRDATRRAAIADLISGLRAELRRLAPRVGHDDLVTLLLLAGEMEAALEDAGLANLQAARLTDLLADATTDVGSCDGHRLSTAAALLLDGIASSGIVTVTTPEGFAHYALHPFDFTGRAATLQLDAAQAFVVGVRSIGTTLSAVVMAQLRQLGISARRTTVRPAGHPYDRRCQFTPLQRHDIRRALSANAAFLVCDEGPGRSGSSLISVAEAMEREGVPRERIVILCSHQPETAKLCAPDAARRWSRYRSAAVGRQRLPCDAGEFLGAGQWRRRLIPSRDLWPAVWPQMDRLRYCSADGQSLLTFEGYGPYGSRVSARNRALADTAFGIAYLGHEAGFGRHVFVSGRAARRGDVTPELLATMAKYCAWRAREFALDAGSEDLQWAMATNFQREFGTTLEDFALPVERPALCDARMAPHQWWQTADGCWRKYNAAIHGDDCFFPGPCDIAWDLAGIIVEWELSTPARKSLMTSYQCASGDKVETRIANYELAYATFRMAWTKMAAASVSEPAERDRLLRDYRRYRKFLSTSMGMEHAEPYATSR